jgi:hypothetical protein
MRGPRQGSGFLNSASVQKEEKGVGGQPVNQEDSLDFSAGGEPVFITIVRNQSICSKKEEGGFFFLFLYQKASIYCFKSLLNQPLTINNFP